MPVSVAWATLSPAAPRTGPGGSDGGAAATPTRRRRPRLRCGRMRGRGGEADPGDARSGRWTFSLGEAAAGLAGEAAGLTATIETSVAALRCTLETVEAPVTVANFVGLARGLRPWWDPCRGEWVREPMYDGMKFHRLEAGFVAQTGCPIGDGTGGPGYAIADEIAPGRRHDGPGVLSMANVGPGTAGSQFFVVFAAATELDRRFTPFGRCGPAGEVAKLDEAARPRGTGDGDDRARRARRWDEPELVVATVICVLAAGAGCKKKAEDKGNAAGSTLVTSAAPGDLEQGGTAR